MLRPLGLKRFRTILKYMNIKKILKIKKENFFILKIFQKKVLIILFT